MKDDLIEFLKRFDTNEISNSMAQNHPGFRRAIEAEAIKRDERQNMYVLTASGYDLLQRWYVLKATREFNEAIRRFDMTSTELSKESLKHTKTMKNLTWAILGFTLANLLFIAIQIYLQFRGGN